MDSQERLRRLLDAASGHVLAEAHCVLAPLKEYDAAHAGDLLHTLHVYLSLGCNASRTAQALYLHRSSLLYRLGRIEDLLGVRLDSFEQRIALEIAIHALEDS